jgi:hypothetical protein
MSTTDRVQAQIAAVCRRKGRSEQYEATMALTALAMAFAIPHGRTWD